MTNGLVKEIMTISVLEEIMTNGLVEEIVTICPVQKIMIIEKLSRQEKEDGLSDTRDDH